MSYTPVPQVLSDEKEHRRKLATAINALQQGRLNALTEVTLTANSATTTLTDSRLSVDSFIGLMPTTANAAGALSTTYIDGQNKGTAIIHHANNAQMDRTFTILVIG